MLPPFSRTGPSVNVSGGRENDNNIMLDGTTRTTPWFRKTQNLPSPEALDEFRVLTNTYSAEYGRAAGGVFLAVSKSGTNNFYGALWEFLRNDALNGRNALSLTRPFFRKKQYGGSFGGPILSPGLERAQPFVLLHVLPGFDDPPAGPEGEFSLV